MSFHLVVRPEVDVELLEAEAWYEGQQAGLGGCFCTLPGRQWRIWQMNHFFTAFDIDD